MEQIHELFENGKYDYVIQKLGDLSQDGLQEQLSCQNNITVCEYMKTNGVDSLEVERCLKSLDMILLKLSSMPSKEAPLSLELTALWNYMYIFIKHRGQFTQKVAVYYIINRTFYRVCSLLPGYKKEKAMSTDLNPEARSTCFMVVDVCCKLLPFAMNGSRGIFWLFSNCCQLVAIMTALDKDYILAYTLLKNLKEIGENFVHSTEKKEEDPCNRNLSLKFTVDHKHLFLRESKLVSMSSFLMGCFHCMADQWEEGIRCMEDVEMNEDLKVAAHVVTGYGLYRTKKYNEAIAVFMETLRSCDIATQKLKARIYNWIGMCFENLGKVQLSIQMYKEALSADFGFLRPLYNTSVQYKTLNMGDMELECLNLLVTALEMKEKENGVKEVGIDLLHLVPIQDPDITHLEALYCFSSRSLQLQRYTVAVEKYKLLITHLQSWDSQDYSGLPSLLQVHHEAILALLKANHLTDCLTLCNKVISCYHNNTPVLDINLTFSQDNPDISFVQTTSEQTMLETSVISSSTRKRKRSPSESFMEDTSVILPSSINMGSDSENTLYEDDVVACKYKAEVLYKLGQHDKALDSAQRAVDSITTYRKKIFRLKGASVLSTKTPSSSQQPAAKKAKLTDEPHMSVSNPAEALFWKLHRHSDSLLMEYDLYLLMAKILTDSKQPGDALHFQRLAAQIKPEQTG